MTKKEKPKTTINIPPSALGPFHDLALALGQTQRYGGKVMGSNTKLMRHIMRLVEDFGADTVAAALQPEHLSCMRRLAEVAGDKDNGKAEAD